MPKLLYVEADDEIADVVSAVKATPDHEIALVFPLRARALQTPLNVRLLAQYATGESKRISVVSEDTRIQQMARNASFATYASVPAYERGIEATRPHDGGLAATSEVAEGGTGLATVVAQPKTTEELSSAWTAAPVAQPGGSSRKPPVKRPTDRRPLYFAAVALAVIGLLLFLFVAPTATVTVTVAATPLSVNPVIQGATGSSTQQANHISTQVLSETSSNNFTATPTGSKQLPATASSGTIEISTDVSAGFQGMLTPDNSTFTTSGSNPITYVPTQDTYLCIGANGQTPPPCDPDGQTYPPNANIPVQATTAGSNTNISGSTSLTWANGNPCNKNKGSVGPSCNPSSDITVTAPSGLTGGADSKTVTTASASDVSGWTTQVQQMNQTLENKLTTQLKSELTTQEAVAVDPGGNGQSVSCSQPNPPLPTAGSAFNSSTITITCEGQYAVYKPADVHADLTQDLQASGQLPQGDQLLAKSCTYGHPQVTQASTSGIVIISASASCWAIPTVSLSHLESQITGESTGDAARTLEQQITGVQKVVSVIHPVGFLLPFFASRISIVIVPQKTLPPSS